MQRMAQTWVIALAIYLSSPMPAFGRDPRPNILLVLLDDAGFMDFGSYGSDTRTPTIDGLARQGTMFSRYYTSPSCGPSRAMLLTGQDNHSVGMGALVETITPQMAQTPAYSMVWKEGQQTIASRLASAGYQTFVTGKWGIGRVGENLPNRFGFDRSFVMDATGGNNYNKGSYLPSKAHTKWFEDEKAYWARVKQTNAGMMEAADFHIGRLLEHLDEKGVLENTLVIVTSDNGAESAVMAQAKGAEGALISAWMMYEGLYANIENLGEATNLTSIGPEWAAVSSAPFRFYKFNGSEGGLRVPLVIAGPGVESMSVRNGRVHVTDLAPTLLEAAEVSYEGSEFMGRSLMPVLRRETEDVYEDDEVVGFEVQGTGGIYRGDWKITRVPPPLGDGQWHLYNITRDPGETHDLAEENPVLFQELLNDYQVRQTAGREQPPQWPRDFRGHRDRTGRFFPKRRRRDANLSRAPLHRCSLPAVCRTW